MPTFRDLLSSLPSDTQDLLKMVWETLPPSEREQLQNMFNGFPTETNLMRLLVNLSMVEVKMAFGRKHRVAIVGPANVGKSTLYNQFIRSKSDRAEVGPLPGTTRANQQADAGLFSVVDTPGADAIGEVGEKERQTALQAASESDFLVIVFDAIQGIKKGELELYEELKTLNKPYIIVLNKIDLVRRDANRVIEKVAANLRIKPDQVIGVSAKNGSNVEKILISIAITEPQMVAALGHALPAYRWQLAWRTIVSAASVSAAIALTPLPFIDFAPLIVTQSIMVLGIARIYDYKITLARSRELVITFGLGFLGRTLFQEISKFGGIPGWLLSAAIAASTTVTMGYAAATWFEKGEKLSSETMKEITKRISLAILTSIRSLGKRKPSQAVLQEKISEALEATEYGKNPELIPNKPPEDSTKTGANVDVELPANEPTQE